MRIEPENGLWRSWEVGKRAREHQLSATKNRRFWPILADFPDFAGVFGVQIEDVVGDLVVIWGVCEQFR